MLVNVKKPAIPVGTPKAVTEVETREIISKTLAPRLVGNPLPKVQHLDASNSSFLKIMAFGEPGSGKTDAIVGFLLAGLKIFVLTTDLGGSGLVTVSNRLKALGREDLLVNIKNVDLNEVPHIITFLEHPENVYPEIYEFNPDMLVWEGYSFFQTVVLDEYVLETEQIGKSEIELRDKGLFAVQTDWNAMRRGSMRYSNKFLQMHNKQTGKLWHKYMTFQEDMPERDKEGKELTTYKRKPLLYTAANTLIRAGFDLVIHMAVLHGSQGKIDYKYRTQSSPQLYAKNRAMPILPEEPANMSLLWEKINPTKEIL